MATLDDVAEVALALPGTSEGDRRGQRVWTVGGRTFAWERPFTKADLKRFGDETPPGGPILGVRVSDLGEKEAVLAAGTPGIFTISHFDNYPAVLVALRRIRKPALRDAVVDAWLAYAAPAVAEEYLKRHRRR